MDKGLLQELLRRYLNNNATPEEQSQLWNLIALATQTELDDALQFVQPPIRDHGQTQETQRTQIFDRIMLEASVYESVKKQTRPTRVISFEKRSWLAYAAAILLLIGAGAYLWNYSRERTTITTTQNTPNHSDDGIPPGSQKAILTLSNGEKVELNRSSRQLIRDGGQVITNEQGSLMYKPSDVVVYNTVTTPRGGQYCVVLPDGGKVWLNAASSITYPTAFKEGIRKVKFTGEAFFEVTPNARQPFVIESKSDTVTVLGTTFNVHSYPEDASGKISLVTGSLKVGQLMVRPGQAASYGKVYPTLLQRDLAWKNGVFDFNDLNLKEVLQQISRWYDIDVVFEGRVPDAEFGGRMSRDLPLTDVLSFLKGSNIHFRMENRKLIVYP